ncbi:N-acetylmuramoyl-L-alanine amidase [Streptomyces ipomoeae]|uniref:N-acetylmuramoyl-L-alanine amidase n=2 Tax=Streptomyces ipomoeae TaxID=103232 RepID=L1L2L4_9ACTN|nr:peptidoglycan-binding protein [Streptomyces ipomoeae]EKX67152.1 N-acetylmuramoyl-L-alanine amidase [Streptomyces ipomoeae 91-03]MDX2698092.1 peptidoglycan-binding protein [Streptomyces ipomoeae]MDX2846493.1 peptidoglycan-binding protein [Streptomyces ipomoeae]TQE15190.1 N-acetylmuramoyl-L-alanine amidase [Streptomyces ipomoeae]
MATPLSAAAFEAALRAEGVTIKEYANWSTHNRNAVGAWGPAQGVMLHHTAGSNSVSLCRNGMADLPGPLCIAVIAKDGTVHLIGYGRTNHAGRGATATYNAVRNGTSIPSRPGSDAVDGNVHFYGFEIENLGNVRDPYPDAQLAAVEKVAAAVCRAHGWGAGRVIGHKEWTTRKIDPTFSMASMRTRIAKRLAKPATGSGTGTGSGSGTSVTAYEPFPGAAFFTNGRRSAVITAMGKRLVAEGCGRYEVAPGPTWTAADRRSYAAWQHKLGYSGTDADGIPGPTSWAKLRVPRV